MKSNQAGQEGRKKRPRTTGISRHRLDRVVIWARQRGIEGQLEQKSANLSHLALP